MNEFPNTAASGVAEPADSALPTGYRTKWVGVRDLLRFGPTPEEQQRMAALAGSTDEDFGYPADMGEGHQD